MKALSRLQSIVFAAGALLMLAGAIMGMMAPQVAPWIFAIGALAYTAMQLQQRYQGDNITIRRLSRIMLLSDVLLIGVGYDKNTSLHLADVRAEYPRKHTCVEHSAVMENGKRVWKAYETLFVDGGDFRDIGAAFEAAHPVNTADLGGTVIRLMRQRELVDFAVEWIEKNRKQRP